MTLALPAKDGPQIKQQSPGKTAGAFKKKRMPISELYNECCMAGMARYPDKYFDLAIVDPPYFDGPNKRGFYGKEINRLNIRRVNYPKTDTWEVPDEKYFKELFRVSKEQIIWGCNYYKYLFGPGRIIWDKVNGRSSFSDAEIAYCSLHDSTRIFRYMWNGMMQGLNITEGHIQQGNKSLNEKRIHPTQKPIALYDWTFKNYAHPGFIILDTHVGSGSSRISAHKIVLDFIGFEKNITHFNNCEKRFKNAIAQQRLFT